MRISPENAGLGEMADILAKYYEVVERVENSNAVGPTPAYDVIVHTVPSKMQRLHKLPDMDVPKFNSDHQK